MRLYRLVTLNQIQSGVQIVWQTCSLTASQIKLRVPSEPNYGSLTYEDLLICVGKLIKLLPCQLVLWLRLDLSGPVPKFALEILFWEFCASSSRLDSKEWSCCLGCVIFSISNKIVSQRGRVDHVYILFIYPYVLNKIFDFPLLFEWYQHNRRKWKLSVQMMTKGVFMNLTSSLISLIGRKSWKTRISKPESNIFDDTQVVATWSTACSSAPVKMSKGRLEFIVGFWPSASFMQILDFDFSKQKIVKPESIYSNPECLISRNSDVSIIHQYLPNKVETLWEYLTVRQKKFL